MTVPSDVSKSGPYLGNGVTTMFDYDFRIVDEDHIKVIKTSTDDVETVLTIDTDYIVSDVGNANGGQVALTVAPAEGEKITLLRNPPFTQDTDLENQGAYYAETVEDRFDLLTMQIQTVKERSDRSVAIPASADSSELNGLIEDIVRLRDSADNIDTVANNIDDVETVVANIGSINTTAGNIDAINNAVSQSRRILEPSATAPATRDNGDPLEAGDYYFDTTEQTGMVWTGSQWTFAGLSDVQVIDEDDMASDSATKVPTQQSVKAYADARTIDQADIRVFGAVPSGLSADAAVNAAAVRNAILATGRAVIPSTEDGFHFGDETIVLDKDERIVGAGQRPKVFSTAKVFISYEGASTGLKGRIENLTIDMAGSPSILSHAVGLRTDKSFIAGCEIIDVTFLNCVRAVADFTELDFDLTNAFTTTSGSAVVFINVPSHGFTQDKVITISDAGTIDGIDMDGSYTAQYVDENTFKFTAATVASDGVTDNGSCNVNFENSYVHDLYLEGVRTQKERGTQIRLDKSQGFVHLSRVVLNRTQDAVLEPMPIEFAVWPSIYIVDPVGVIMSDVDLQGQGVIPEREVAISIASPAVLTRANHGLSNGSRVQLSTDGSLPTGLAPATTYFVVNATMDTFSLAATAGGAAINTSGSQSGTHKFGRAIYTPSARGVHIVSPNRNFEFIWMDRCRSEAGLGNDFDINDANFVFMSRCDSFGCRGLPWIFVDCDRVLRSSCMTRGGRDQLGCVTGQHGVTLTRVDDYHEVIPHIEECTGDGYRLTDSTRVEVSGGQIQNNDGAPVREAGSSNHNTFREVWTKGNGESNPIINGANSTWKGGAISDARWPDGGWAVSAHRGGVDTGAIASATWTQLICGTEQFDYGNRYDTNSSRITPPAGPCRILARALVINGVVDGSPCTIAIRKNGAVTAIAEYTAVPGAASPVTLVIEAADVANGTDYYEGWVFLGGAGSKTISGAARYTRIEGYPL